MSLYFFYSQVTFANKMLELLYVIIGLICIYAGVKNLKDKEKVNNKKKSIQLHINKKRSCISCVIQEKVVLLKC